MHLTSLLEIVESGLADRVVIGDASCSLTGAQFGQLARQGGSVAKGHSAVVYIGENHPMLPIALFSAVWAGMPFVPINYRLHDDQLNGVLALQPGSLVLTDSRTFERVSTEAPVRPFDEWLHALADHPAADAPAVVDDDDVALVLYTSGTTSAPKTALLRHRHLMAYLLGSVEFGSAADDEAVLIAVPPYHVAGVANLLSNLFAGRRLVYLRAFDAEDWLAKVRSERVSHAMVVPTMLARIVDLLSGASANVPTLRSLSYGGAKVSERVITDALRVFPDTGFVNAYGLTETASTIAVLSPDDHRAAIASGDAVVRRRLSSVGRPLPTVEVEIRDETDVARTAGQAGMIYLRGDQIAGEYASGSLLDEDGWFCTRDRGWIDEDGYLFIEGRADDTIIRGGENIAPAEIEEILMAHPAVAEACVVGMSDDEWGQRIVAVVVGRRGEHVEGDELREYVRGRLGGSKAPDAVVVRDALPYTETGKMLRQAVRQDIENTVDQSR